jgi:hypothetical protein
MTVHTGRYTETDESIYEYRRIMTPYIIVNIPWQVIALIHWQKYRIINKCSCNANMVHICTLYIGVTSTDKKTARAFNTSVIVVAHGFVTLLDIMYIVCCLTDSFTGKYSVLFMATWTHTSHWPICTQNIIFISSSLFFNNSAVGT